MTRKFYEIAVYICVIIGLWIIYSECNNFANKGYGCPGYGGYNRTHYHSFWYIRNHDEAYSGSVRENSTNGNKFSQRGLSGGK